MYGIIQNALSKNLIDEALNLYLTSTNQMFNGSSSQERYISGALGVFILSKYNSDEFKNIWDHIEPKLHAELNKKIVPVHFRILRYGTLGFLKAHKDSTKDPEFNRDSVSIIILLNNWFSGGEFFIDGNNIDLNVGDLLFCTEDHVHGVKAVTDGTRYSINIRCVVEEG
jgi:hypothetical protein